MHDLGALINNKYLLGLLAIVGVGAAIRRTNLYLILTQKPYYLIPYKGTLNEEITTNLVKPEHRTFREFGDARKWGTLYYESNVEVKCANIKPKDDITDQDLRQLSDYDQELRFFKFYNDHYNNDVLHLLYIASILLSIGGMCYNPWVTSISATAMMAIGYPIVSYCNQRIDNFVDTCSNLPILAGKNFNVGESVKDNYGSTLA